MARERSNFEYKCKLVSPLITSGDTSRAMRLTGLQRTLIFLRLAESFARFLISCKSKSNLLTLVFERDHNALTKNIDRISEPKWEFIIEEYIGE